MGITDRDRNRLAALVLLIRPSHSLASRVDKLSDEHRAQFENYRARMKAFIARNDLDDAYARSLEGYGPQLPKTIYTALYGPRMTIPITASEEDAQRLFLEECKR